MIYFCVVRKKKYSQRKPSSLHTSLCPSMEYAEIFFSPNALTRMLVHFVNHRLIQAADPITQTLVLMVNTPVQLLLCETGLIAFQNNELPVYPYAKMTKRQLRFLHDTLKRTEENKLQLSASFLGRFSLKIPLVVGNKTAYFISKKAILHSLARTMQQHKVHKIDHVQATLCSIIQQRFTAAFPAEIPPPQAEEETYLQLKQLV